MVTNLSTVGLVAPEERIASTLSFLLELDL